MKKTIAIVGGSQESTFKKIGKRHGLNILFHNGRNGSKKEYRNIVKSSDAVVILLGACGHIAMDLVKDCCKKYGKELLFHQGFGATGAIEMCVERFRVLENKVA